MNKEIKKLANDCLTMTLHGPIPTKTTMKLAEAIVNEPDSNKKVQLEDIHTAARKILEYLNFDLSVDSVQEDVETLAGIIIETLGIA
jgi:hypothetical protein